MAWFDQRHTDPMPPDIEALRDSTEPVWIFACESARKQDPGQNRSKSLKSSAKTPEVGGPDRRRSGPHPKQNLLSMYQGVEGYPRWGPASVLIHSLGTGGSQTPRRRGVDSNLESLHEKFAEPMIKTGGTTPDAC